MFLVLGDMKEFVKTKQVTEEFERLPPALACEVPPFWLLTENFFAPQSKVQQLQPVSAI